MFSKRVSSQKITNSLDESICKKEKLACMFMMLIVWSEILSNVTPNRQYILEQHPLF